MCMWQVRSDSGLAWGFAGLKRRRRGPRTLTFPPIPDESDLCSQPLSLLSCWDVSVLCRTGCRVGGGDDKHWAVTPLQWHHAIIFALISVISCCPYAGHCPRGGGAGFCSRGGNGEQRPLAPHHPHPAFAPLLSAVYLMFHITMCRTSWSAFIWWWP